MTNIGRIDATLKAGKYIYLIECKIDKTAEEALNQIDEKKYSEQFYNDLKSGFSIVKIGMNFSTDPSVRNIEKVVSKVSSENKT